MPLEVKIPKEITEYREKIIFGMSIRQLICTLIAALISIITFFSIRKYIGSDLAGYLVLVEAMPVMGIGFLRVNGFSFEKYLAIILSHLLSNQKRYYKADVSIDTLDFYSDFGLGVSANEELISKAKKEKFSRVRGEKTNSRVSKKTNKREKANTKTAK
ncbi:MAG: PrgI family protein [Clostridiales bacterium]|jgi:hypothetical protein|nr:PrgI family protein [Clostridiales bacterium]